ncbi:MAG: hypothetical protein PVF58_16690 [Candidatus Methanofastidiosia archaeon]
MKVGKSLFCGWPSVFVTDSEEELKPHMKERADQNNVSVEKLREKFQKYAPGSRDTLKM